jgi:hypothetical protein
MTTVPGSLETDTDLPLELPLRHFIVALGFLLAATLVAAGGDVLPGLATLAMVHLLLAGWVCITIMGAMTQFVPVWSGTTLHSHRLASVQLWCVVAGISGFVVALLLGALAWLLPFGALLLTGFWVFAYNILRTLSTLDSYDVTERHFGYAIGFLMTATLFGVVLAADFTLPITDTLPVTHGALKGAHATIAVFGVVLTTIYGALYQLGMMFTQTELHGVDTTLQSLEAAGHPLGVVLLAGGRLLESGALARVGGLLVVLAALAVAVVLGRRLLEMQVEWQPMHTRYAVATVALVVWAALTGPAWLRTPLGAPHLFGAAGSVHLLVLGAIGMVVVGTLYHIVPFIIWVNSYSDRLGYEPVPMVNDLYSSRLAAVDGSLWVGGTALLAISQWVPLSPAVAAVAGTLLTLGAMAVAANMVLVIYRHGPRPLDRVLLGSASPCPEARGESDPAD